MVSVNGTTQVEKDLPQYLIRETKGNPTIGLVQCSDDRVEGDSSVYTTRPEKGEIEYRGNVVNGSMVRFLRHSHITGTKQVMEYIFYPDERALRVGSAVGRPSAATRRWPRGRVIAFSACEVRLVPTR